MQKIIGIQVALKMIEYPLGYSFLGNAYVNGAQITFVTGRKNLKDSGIIQGSEIFIDSVNMATPVAPEIPVNQRPALPLAPEIPADPLFESFQITALVDGVFTIFTIANLTTNISEILSLFLVAEARELERRCFST